MANPPGYVPGGSSPAVGKAIKVASKPKPKPSVKPPVPNRAPVKTPVQKPPPTLQQQAQTQVSALYQPLIEQLKASIEARSQSGQGAITGYTSSLAKLLSGFAPQAQAAFTQAQGQTAAANAALSSELKGAGSDVAAGLADRLKAVGADPNLAQTQATIGQGSAGALYGSGTADLNRLIAQGADAQTYFNKQPGIAALGGLQKSKELQSQLSAELTQKLGDLQAKEPDTYNAIISQLQSAQLAQQKFSYTQYKDANNYNLSVAKYDTSTKLGIARLNQSATRIANQALQSDRSYGVALANLGLKTEAGQRAALAAEVKLKSGGFSAVALNRFKTDAADVINLASTAKNPPTYKAIMEMMLKRHVPISMAQAAIHKYNPTLQGEPINLASLNAYNAMTGVSSSPKANDVVGLASADLGTKYVWGGSTPGKALDCSGFTQAAYARVGIAIPRTTYAQVKAGRPVNLNQLKPGDLVFTEPGKNGPNHVGMYIGNGQIQESPHTGDVNKIISLKDFLSGGFVAARRYVG